MTKKWPFGNFCLKNNQIFRQFAWKNRNYSEICLEIEFFTRIHDPQDFKPDWRHWWALISMLQHVYYIIAIIAGIKIERTRSSRLHAYLEINDDQL